jgi:hypothetical protein
VLAGGCDVGNPEREPVDAPPVHLVAVELTGLDTNGQVSTLALSPSAPSLPDTSRVLSTTSVRLEFDRFLLPGDAIRQSICLQPSSEPVATLGDCRLPVFLEPSYDPVWRRATYRLPAMAKLVADTKYWLTVLAPTEASAFGFRAFDRAPLAENVVLQFTTAATDPPGAPVETSLDEAGRRAASEELFCTASACVAACGADQACADRCPVSKSMPLACGGCHLPIETGGAVMGLDLSGPERIEAILGRVAHQTQTGEQADEPDVPRRFGRAMPQVDPGNAGNSYLLYKMLVSPIYARMDAAKSLAPGEIDRLRASTVVGLPMPPYDLYAVPQGGIEALSAWIMTGARTPVCP